MPENEGVKGSASRRLNDEELLQAKKLYLHDNYAQQLNMKKMAEHFKVSVYRLQNVFAKVESGSIHSYIKNYRLKMAAGFLTDTGLPIGEIARRIGYESHSKFARAFCQYSGFSPLKFRKLNRK